MSEILDKIRIIQEKTGCSVIKGKELLDLAGGDVDLAVAIYQEESGNQNAPSNPTPQPGQSPNPVPQGVPSSNFETQRVGISVAQPNHPPKAEMISVPRPSEPGAHIASPKNQYGNAPTSIAIPRPASTNVNNTSNVQQPRPHYYDNGQPMATVLPRQIVPEVGPQLVQTHQDNGPAPSISVPKPVHPEVAAVRERKPQPQNQGPVVIPPPAQPGVEPAQPFVQTPPPIQRAQPVTPVYQPQPVILSSPDQARQQSLNNHPGQPMARFKVEKPTTQFFQSSINSPTQNVGRPGPTSISVPGPQKQGARVVTHTGENNAPKQTQAPRSGVSGPNAHFVMSKPVSQINSAQPVVVNQGGPTFGQNPGTVQSAPTPVGQARSLLPDNRPKAHVALQNQAPSDDNKK